MFSRITAFSLPKSLRYSLPIPLPKYNPTRGIITLIIRYTGINTYAYKGLNCNAMRIVVTGKSITVNIGPIVWAKKYSKVSISPTAMLITSPIF